MNTPVLKTVDARLTYMKVYRLGYYFPYWNIKSEVNSYYEELYIMAVL